VDEEAKSNPPPLADAMDTDDEKKPATGELAAPPQKMILAGLLEFLEGC